VAYDLLLSGAKLLQCRGECSRLQGITRVYANPSALAQRVAKRRRWLHTSESVKPSLCHADVSGVVNAHRRGTKPPHGLEMATRERKAQCKDGSWLERQQCLHHFHPAVPRDDADCRKLLLLSHLWRCGESKHMPHPVPALTRAYHPKVDAGRLCRTRLQQLSLLSQAC
jgi:hypothetical protein